MTKKAAILIEDNYQVLEVWYPYLRLKEDGIETVMVGTGRNKEYRSKEGYPADEQMSIDNADAAEFDCVIIPGGYAPDILRRKSSINEFVKDMFAQGKVVAAICHGPWVLVSADVLKDMKSTSFYAIKDDVVNAGSHWEDSEVVVDKNLITARNPYDLPAFCSEIIRNIKQD